MESWNIVDNADDAGNVGDAGTSELEPLKALAKAPHVAGSNSRKKLSFNGVRRPPHIVFTPLPTFTFGATKTFCPNEQFVPIFEPVDI